ncbi:MAG TPA: fused MFS/spermidine synthase [Anaeromyxobacteraceae bacterium]|nr:fused MFS/spermidine synthase [Anaeromyxobacteraceae bacterium]
MAPPRSHRRPRVEVRRTARGLELRVDGTLASNHPAGGQGSGPVWDALALPLLALPPARRRNLLVLGLGGGSVVRTLRALAPAARIVGVEIDPDVVAAARGHLGLDALGVEVVLDDALGALRAERRRFDVIVEDVFVGPVRTVRKPPGFPEPLLALARRRLAPGGLLVCNTIHEGPQVARALRAHAPALLAIHVRGYWNRILVGGPTIDAAALRRAAARERVLSASLPALAIRRSRLGERPA